MTESAQMRVAVITGASSGIGEAFARELHQHGWIVVCVARRQARLEALCDELNQIRPGSAEYVVCDLSSSGDAAAGFEAQSHSLKSLCDILSRRQVDLLVNNAGFGSFGEFDQLDLLNEQAMIRVNIDAPLALSHAVIPGMKSRSRGSIVMVSSIAAFQPLPYMATYGATKAFEHSFSLALREELRPFGISVLAVCPGPTSTEFGVSAGFPALTAPEVGVTPMQVVKDALAGLAREQRVVIPGWRSALMAYGASIVPKWLSMALVAQFMKRSRQKL